MVLKEQRPDLMKGVPRGLKDKFLKDQKAPMSAWQTTDAILNHKPFDYDPKQPNGALVMGAIGEKLIGIKDERHIVTCAQNRSGKSVTVINNLFFYDGSVIAFDSKGELSELTAAARAKLGQTIMVLDPYGIARGEARKYRARYNPIRTLDINADSVIEDVLLIVESIVVASGAEKDPHWNESASNFLLGLILFVAFASNIEDEDRNLITVRKLIKMAKQTVRLDEKTVVFKLTMLADEGIAHLRGTEHDDIAETIEGCIRDFYDKSHEELAGVLSTCRRHSAMFDWRSMRKSLSGHDFDLRDLKRKNMTIYLVLPSTKMHACKRWLRMFVNQLIAAMEQEQTVPEQPVLAVLDEFPVMGHLPALENAVGQVASFHLRFWFIFQDIGQLESIFKNRWQSFLANAGIFQYFANMDLKTTEYISKILGKTPVFGLRQNDVSTKQTDSGVGGQSSSKELHPLMAPDEISRVFSRADALKRQIVQWAGFAPMIIQRVEWWNKDAPYTKEFNGVR